MSVYRPTYRDPKTGETKQQAVWWYHFQFGGRHVQESSRSTRKTVAVEAEKRRRRELELAYNGIEDNRQERIRTISELADRYFEAYRVRHRSTKFAEYALGHIKRLLGKTMTADVSDATVKNYQTDRLKEKASPKTINEEVGFLLRLLEDRGDAIRGKMRRQRTLKLRGSKQVAKAFTPEQKSGLLSAAKARRSPSIYPALVLALNAGMRDSELRGLQWSRVDLERAIVTVGDSKTAAGEGRTIPLNSDALEAMVEHAKWFLKKFGEMRPHWFVFPFGKPQPTDPTRGCTTFRTVWARVLEAAGIEGRWHDSRHTFITDLAESGAGDQTIMDMAGHVSKQMLTHYSHIRMEAKRKAVAALVRKPEAGTVPQGQSSDEAAKESAKVGQVN